MERKKLLILMCSICLVLVLIALSFSACAKPAPAPVPTTPPTLAPTTAPTPAEPYKLGLVISLTGDMAPMGKTHRDATLLAVNKINADGGINGHPLNVIVYDDGSDPSTGVMAIKKLIDTDKVLGIMGPAATGVAIACAPIAEESQVPMFAGNSSDWSVALKPWQIPNPPTNIRHWVFKLGIDPVFQAMGMYGMLKQMGAINIAEINVNNAMGEAMKAAMEATYKQAGFNVVIEEEYGPNDTDMTAQLTKIKATKFDAMIIWGAEMAGGITYKQARELGITQPILGACPLLAPDIVAALGKSLDGIRIPSFVMLLGDSLPQDNPQRSQVLELTNLLGKMADTGAGTGWDSTFVFADALRRANPDLTDLAKARSQIRDAMETIKGFVGVYCIGDMNKWHDIPCPYIPVEYTGGKLVVIGNEITPGWEQLQ